MTPSPELKLRGFRLSGFYAALRQVPGDSSCEPAAPAIRARPALLIFSAAFKSAFAL